MDERAYFINPIVPESLQHNVKVLSRLRNLTSSLFGVAAGVLGLEAYIGFLFYLLGTVLVSSLIWALLAHGRPGRYFGTGVSTGAASGSGSGAGGSAETEEQEEREGAGWKLWTEDVVSGLSSFVLTWTLFYGLVRA